MPLHRALAVTAVLPACVQCDEMFRDLAELAVEKQLWAAKAMLFRFANRAPQIFQVENENRVWGHYQQKHVFGKWVAFSCSSVWGVLFHIEKDTSLRTPTEKARIVVRSS